MKSREQPTPMHPGSLLRLMVLPAAGMNASQLARASKLGRTNLHNILHGRAGISPSLAVHLAALFGVPVTVWLDMQQRYDIHMAESELRNDLAEISPYAGPPLDIEQMVARLERFHRPAPQDEVARGSLGYV